MTWERFSRGLRLDPIAKRPAETLVVLLQDAGESAAALTPVVSHWAPAVPTAAFIILDENAQLDPLSLALPFQGEPDLGVSSTNLITDPMVLDQAVRQIEPQLEQQMRFHRLDASQSVLVGFGQGGMIALNLLLHGTRRYAGALAFSAKLIRPPTQIARVDGKVRLIERTRHGGMNHVNLRDTVMSLVSRGVDARGVVLTGAMLSDEAIRHGGAYLVELVATAQRHDRFHLEQESSDAQ